MSAKEIDKNKAIKNIKKILKGTGYKTNMIYGTYYFSLFKKDKIKLENRNHWFECCITFYHEEKTFAKSSRPIEDYAIWNSEMINMKELEMINKIVYELGWGV
jgi:hypothetical protein